MAVQNTITLDVDIKKPNYIIEPTVTANDNVIFILNIFDNDIPVDLVNVSTITLANKRLDTRTVITPGEKSPTNSNQVIVELGRSETAINGRVAATVQLYDASGRVSTIAFGYVVKNDPAGANYLPTVNESTLIEVVLRDGPLVIAEAVRVTDVTRQSGLDADAARTALTGSVGNALNSLAIDKAAALAEIEAEKNATEAERLATAAERSATTNVKTATEAVRVATEAVRLATELVRTQTITVKDATESERVATATERVATAAERATIAAVKAATEAVRVATENERLAIRNQQSAFEANIAPRVTAVEAKATTTEAIAILAKARADLIIGQAGSSNTEIVDSRLGADLVARATSGELIREIHANQLESARQTTTLSTGVSVVSGGVDALAETEIEGRTLISLGNSNLEALKQYVVADKKTKVVTDGVTYSGVAKFTKGTTTVSTANFVGKVAGSNIVNPHQSFYNSYNNMAIGGVEFPQPSYDGAKNLGGNLSTTSFVGAGAISKHQFSFDIIQEIERKLGIIPKTTPAEKVQWVKDNVYTLVTRWHGFGSSVGGNKASLAIWAGSWIGATSHSNGTVTSLSKGQDFELFPGDKVVIGADGFIHYLAYAEPSDGTTASSVSTDYIDLVITLKATAQLNTRATIVRVENFEGKVSGSVVENAHVSKFAYQTTLQAPNSGLNGEADSNSYVGMSILNGSLAIRQNFTNGVIAQQFFSFNLIEAIERNIGKIPRNTVADKVQWIKDNVNRLTGVWHGFGSSVGGNKAYLQRYITSSNTWFGSSSHTNSTVTSLSTGSNGGVDNLDANGFSHYIAYADPSDGITPSTINTDYFSCEIELKPTADFTRPKVALYEASAENYPKILVDWSADEVVNRYPIVEGVQHLQGVGVVSEGENLLPPFYEWNLHATSTVRGAYDLEANPTAGNMLNDVSFNVLPSTQYTLTVPTFATYSSGQRVYIYYDGVVKHQPSNGLPFTFTTDATTKVIKMAFFSQSAGKFVFTNPMLTLGNAPKPFVPRNPSYLYADVKLGAIGTARDTLYEQDGAKFVRKVIEKDVVLDGSLAWVHHSDYAGYKRLTVATISRTNGSDGVVSSKYDGKLSKYNASSPTSPDEFSFLSSGFYISASDNETGFGENFTPPPAEIKAYFHGWKMNNGTYGTNYESTGTKTWIPISDLNNARAVTVVPTSASPTQLDGTIQPYKLSYVLATPQIVNVTNLVEGQLKVNGLTQVEVLSGVVRREKVTPLLQSPVYIINSVTSPLSKKVGKIIAVYKNGILDKKWTVLARTIISAVGIDYATIPIADYDATAIYEVTYIALDKPLLTANPTNVKLMYANNMRSALEDAVGKGQDNATMLSVHEKAIIDLYVRVKALGG